MRTLLIGFGLMAIGIVVFMWLPGLGPGTLLFFIGVVVIVNATKARHKALLSQKPAGAIQTSRSLIRHAIGTALLTIAAILGVLAMYDFMAGKVIFSGPVLMLFLLIAASLFVVGLVFLLLEFFRKS